MITENGYHSADPFFVVKCKKCKAEYWSTRRFNEVCSKCGSKDVSTSVPEHTISMEKDAEK